MANQITLEQALKLVSFKETRPGSGVFAVDRVLGNVYGGVCGRVCGDVCGTIEGDVRGDVCGTIDGDVYGHVGGCVDGDIRGHVRGTIQGRQWQFVETPKERLKRLIDEGADTEQLIEQCVLLEQVND